VALPPWIDNPYEGQQSRDMNLTREFTQDIRDTRIEEVENPFDRRNYDRERREAMDQAERDMAELALSNKYLRDFINDPTVVILPSGELKKMPVKKAQETGRQLIRRSRQFSRYNLLPRLTPPKPRKKNKKHCKNLSTCFREANKKMRKANGQLRKGKTQADVARLAHRLMKKKC
jgi:murein L,D-transpeptidase YcbB/YkuD